MTTTPEQNWRTEAACAAEDPRIFDNRSGERENATDRFFRLVRAKIVCRRCPVTAECLDSGLSDGETGMFGGVLLLDGRVDEDEGTYRPSRRGRPLAPCGTHAAHRRHKARKEAVDEACRLAEIEYQFQRDSGAEGVA